MVYPDSAARPAEVRPSAGFFFAANSIRFSFLWFPAVADASLHNLRVVVRS
jgi:hypothetical protein